MLWVWSEKHFVYVNQIDTQHKKIVDMLNSMNEAMKQGKANEMLDKTVGELLDYTKTHLTFEEGLMKRHNYPQAVGHLDFHAKFIKEINDLHDGFKKGNVGLAIKIMNLLKDWLSNHIMETDKRLGAYLNSVNVH